jgi:2-polyprenyl-3-methyl-5-hydroxy-6-metoxy-1,4-benzoquinol methylase
LNAFDNLKVLINKKGKIDDPVTFQRMVNEIFHDIESVYYDGFHREMWNSLGAVFNRLSEKIYDIGSFSGRLDLKLLDIGSGTGLSTELLLATKISERITDVTLLDSSTGMIEASRKRAASWEREVNFINGYIEEVPVQKYDIILCCSVLHHIPDLDTFFRRLSELQSPGGLFIHLHDPNGDALKSSDYSERVKLFKSHRSRKQLSFFGILYRLKRRVFREDFNSRVNNELLSKGVIRKRLTDKELWSVTDIHVENLPYSTREGISVSSIESFLPSYSLKYKTSYGFFGEMPDSLSGQFKELEEAFSLKDNMDGRHLAGIWVKK